MAQMLLLLRCVTPEPADWVVEGTNPVPPHIAQREGVERAVGPVDVNRNRVRGVRVSGDGLGSWVLDLELRLDGGIAAMTISPADPDDAFLVLSVQTLRKLPIGAAAEQAMAYVRDQLEEYGFRYKDPEFRHVGARLDMSRPGRRGRTLIEYARFAAAYVDWIDTGTSFADFADAQGLTESQARNVLYRAREKALLTSAGRGHRGGRLTEVAIAELSRHKEVN